MPDDLGHLFVETFNIDLAELGSLARIMLLSGEDQPEMVGLHTAKGRLICAIPGDTAPKMAAIVHDLYHEAFAAGLSAGEEAAWAKLRALIGVASG